MIQKFHNLGEWESNFYFNPVTTLLFYFILQFNVSIIHNLIKCND